MQPEVQLYRIEIPHPMAKPNKPANTDITSEYNFRPRNRSPLRDRERNTEFPQRWGSKGDTAVTPVGLSNKLKNKSPPNKGKKRIRIHQKTRCTCTPPAAKKS